MKILFNADDAGATKCITDRIMDAWKLRLIDGFSIIANGDACLEIKKALKENHDLPARLCVHLNLSEGQCLAPKQEVASLVGADGLLHLGFGDVLLLWLRSSGSERAQLISQIKKEWQKQIQAVKRICFPRNIIGLDSHNHVHMLPFLFPVAVSLMQAEGIPEIRIAREIPYLSSMRSESLNSKFFINIIKHILLRICSIQATRLDKELFINSPEAIVGVLYTGMMSASAALSGIKAAENRGVKKLEVLFHIGRASVHEAIRWSPIPKPSSFMLSANRDKEFLELYRLRTSRKINEY